MVTRTRYGVKVTPAMQRVLDRFGGHIPPIAGAEESEEKEPAAAGSGESGDGGKEDELSEAGKAAIQKERKARRDAEKALKEAEARAEDAERQAKEYEDADKTEKEKAEERATKAEADAASAKRTALQYEVAEAKGMKLTAASRLSGGTKEEMEADADKLIEDFGDGVLAGATPKEDKDAPGGKPKGSGGDGGAQTAPSKEQQFARLRGAFPQLREQSKT